MAQGSSGTGAMFSRDAGTPAPGLSGLHPSLPRHDSASASGSKQARWPTEWYPFVGWHDDWGRIPGVFSRRFSDSCPCGSTGSAFPDGAHVALDQFVEDVDNRAPAVPRGGGSVGRGGVDVAHLEAVGAKRNMRLVRRGLISDSVRVPGKSSSPGPFRGDRKLFVGARRPGRVRPGHRECCQAQQMKAAAGFALASGRSMISIKAPVSLLLAWRRILDRGMGHLLEPAIRRRPRGRRQPSAEAFFDQWGE
jgi:hypothetical protein